MGAILFIALVTVPIIEIAIFLEVGDFIGFWPTMGVIVLTAFIGATLLRWQGLATLRKAQASLEQNRFPMEEVFDGLCLLVAGVLLLTPGFFTDAVGFFLFVPVFRRFLARHVARLMIARGHIEVNASGFPPDAAEGTVIDGEFTDLSAGTERSGKNSRQNKDHGDDSGGSTPPKLPGD